MASDFLSFFLFLRREKVKDGVFSTLGAVKTDRPKQQLSLAAITYTVRNKSLSDAKKL